MESEDSMLYGPVIPVSVNTDYKNQFEPPDEAETAENDIKGAEKDQKDAVDQEESVSSEERDDLSSHRKRHKKKHGRDKKKRSSRSRSKSWSKGKKKHSSKSKDKKRKKHKKSRSKLKRSRASGSETGSDNELTDEVAADKEKSSDGNSPKLKEQQGPLREGENGVKRSVRDDELHDTSRGSPIAEGHKSKQRKHSEDKGKYDRHEDDGYYANKDTVFQADGQDQRDREDRKAKRSRRWDDDRGKWGNELPGESGDAKEQGSEWCESPDKHYREDKEHSSRQRYDTHDSQKDADDLSEKPLESVDQQDEMKTLAKASHTTEEKDSTHHEKYDEDRSERHSDRHGKYEDRDRGRDRDYKYSDRRDRYSDRGRDRGRERDRDYDRHRKHSRSRSPYRRSRSRERSRDRRRSDDRDRERIPVKERLGERLGIPHSNFQDDGSMPMQQQVAAVAFGGQIASVVEQMKQASEASQSQSSSSDDPSKENINKMIQDAIAEAAKRAQASKGGQAPVNVTRQIVKQDYMASFIKKDTVSSGDLTGANAVPLGRRDDAAHKSSFESDSGGGGGQSSFGYDRGGFGNYNRRGLGTTRPPFHARGGHTPVQPRADVGSDNQSNEDTNEYGSNSYRRGGGAFRGRGGAADNVTVYGRGSAGFGSRGGGRGAHVEITINPSGASYQTPPGMPHWPLQAFGYQFPPYQYPWPEQGTSEPQKQSSPPPAEPRPKGDGSTEMTESTSTTTTQAPPLSANPAMPSMFPYPYAYPGMIPGYPYPYPPYGYFPMGPMPGMPMGPPPTTMTTDTCTAHSTESKVPAQIVEEQDDSMVMDND